MADEDEDLSYLGVAETADFDATEEAQDFLFLDNLTSAQDTGERSLPKRGEKDFESHDTQHQLEKLEASRRKMHDVLSWERTHTQKGHILAMYDPDRNMAYVEKVKSQHFQTMGTSKGGKEWLLPEEALFLIERGTVDCRWPVRREAGDEERYRTEHGPPMSLQSAYAAFIGFEDGVGGKLTPEMYTVYAGLKRAGYAVFRTGTWDDERGDLLLPPAKEQEKAKPPRGLFTRFFTEIWRRLSHPTHNLTPDGLSFGPLIKPGLYRSYNDIYRLLNMIPTYDRTSPPSFILPPSADNPYRLHFEAYRSMAKFRKSARGPPDFRICVIDARSTPIPTGAQLNDLLAQVPENRPHNNTHPYQKLKKGCRNVIVAVVDNGIPSYVQLADSPFEEVKIYERAGPRGKGGRGRGGRGRGRGGGRGRGR